MVSAHFHVIVTPPPTVWDNVTQTWVPDTTNATLIEQEIMDFMHAHHENENKANFSTLVKFNLEVFLEKYSDTSHGPSRNRFVQLCIEAT